MKLRPVFVDVLPDFDAIKAGELWISHKYRTVNLRCPCGCGDLTVLSLHPSRWHVHFDGKSVSSGRSYRWVRVGQFRLRQPLLHKETTLSFGRVESIQAVIRSMPKSNGRG